MTLRINCWSGPRNVSTALMRSFGQRGDTRVVDEPLYGHYLATTDAPHPGRDELLALLETDAARVIGEVILGPCDRDVLFMKQMVHHLTPELDLSFLDRCVNVLLIRDPAEVLASLVHQLPSPTMRDVGLERGARLFDDLRLRGQDPPVLDARELLLDPEHVLRELCARVGIAWDAAMLSWPAGPRPEDGAWAPYWYDNVVRSTGFEAYRPRSREVPDSCRGLLAQCRRHYDELKAFAIAAPRAAAS
ncbi:MAG: sulfotransferase family protein [Actinomycetota bacterium]